MEKFVSTFEEACAKLGKSTELPDVSAWPEHLQGHLLATFKLDTILQVNNNGWKPNLADTTQKKWYPWFWVEKDNEGPGGFRLASYGFDYDHGASNLGVRLACESSDLARFMGENCPELYKELHK